MIVSMFDKSQLQKALVYFGDGNEPNLLVRSRSTQVASYLHKDDAWIYNEPNKDRGELLRLEAWYEELRMLNAVNNSAVFSPDLMDVSDDIAWRVALTQFRRAVALGCPVDNSSLHRLREYICDGPNGVDDLLDMKPFVKETRVVGEVETTIDGQKTTQDMIE